MYTVNQQFYTSQLIPINNLMVAPQQKVIEAPPPKKTDLKAAKKPKGPISAYTFFVQACRTEHRSKHPNETINFADFSKKCAERWKLMTEDQKRGFAEMSTNDKRRFEAEMASFNAMANQNAYINNYGNHSVPMTSSGIIGNHGSAVPRKKRKKDPNAPKRPLSAFFIFCHDERPSVKAIYPNYSVGEAAKVLGDRWSKVNAEDKAKYEAKAALDKARYDREIANYKGKMFI